ncbi:MAG TPA: hypothetical protein VJ790_11700 [Dongiaceae bacterium]|nr:hypothetical protein [Dongiaceae bacterium]
MIEKLRALQDKLRQEKLAAFKRRMSLGDLITDRLQNAREYSFGEGASCYDTQRLRRSSCHVLRRVRVVLRNGACPM